MPTGPDVLERVADLARVRLHGTSWAGVSIALTGREELVGVVPVGSADLESREPLTEDHLFQIGSVGKSFTAIALLQLHEEGRLELHAPVTEYLPWFQVRSPFPPITIHHLLTHTSGLYTGMEISTDGSFDVWSLRDEEPGFAPGENFHYSNLGYRTLGLVLEAITKSSYAEEIRARILEPLGMEATESAITNDLRPRTAAGYTHLHDDRVHRRDSPLAPAPWFVNATGDGCISSTPADLAVYLRMLMNRGRGPNGRVMSEDSFDLMTQRVSLREGRWYGYGMNAWDIDGRPHLGHGGGMVGYFSDMRADLDSDIGAVVFVNAPDFDVTGEIGRDALDVLRASMAGRPLPEVPDPPDRMRAQDPDAHVGTYRGPDGDLGIEARDGQLTMVDGGETAALEPLAPDQFVPHHPDLDRFRLRFLRRDGRVVEVTHGPRRWWAEGAPSPQDEGLEFDPSWAAFCGHYRSFNPWAPDIRVFRRGSDLILAWYPQGTEDRLTPTGGGRFRVGDEAASPHRVSFDATIDGGTLRATISGAPYYRTPL